MKLQKHIEWIAGALVAALLICLFHFLGIAEPTELQIRSVFVWVFQSWMALQGDFSHSWLMPIAAAGIIWWKRKELVEAEKAVAPEALLVVLSALAMHWCAVRAQQPRVSLVAFTFLLWSIPSYIYGRNIARLIAFPCAYLLLCFLAYYIVAFTLPLRIIATTTATFLLNGLAIPAAHSGTAIFSTAGGGFQFEVADPCSGLRSLTVMSALAALYGYFTLKTSLHKWLLFLASIPLAMLANIFRILTVALVAEWFGQEWAGTVYHDYSGYLVFIFATLFLVATGRVINTDFKAKVQQWKRHGSKPIV